MSTQNIPQQSITYEKKDDTWRQNTVDAYIDQANFQTGSNSDRYFMTKLYDYYNGKINNEDYNYVLEPYGKKRDNFPAKIRNFPLIKPSIDLLVGEKAKRPFNFTVIVSSGDVENIKHQMMQERINEELQKWVIQKLNKAGVNTGIEQEEEPQLPQHIQQIFERNWRDNRAIMAQKALEFLIPYLHYYNEAQKGWFDFLVSGHAMTHKGVYNNEPFFENLNPLDVDYDKDPNVEFIEDGNWAVIRELASRPSVIDKFRSQLTDEEVRRLENPQNSNRDTFFWYNQDNHSFHDEWDSYTELVTVYWKSMKKVGFRMYQDEFGEIYEEIVEEGYEYNPETDYSLDWEWVNEVWQGFRIDGDIYMDIRPIDYQRTSIDNPSKCKLPVNGRAYSERNSKNISLVSLGIPYQLSYNIYKYRLENAIAKSKDILALLDISMIPKGWDMDKFMRILEATGIGWVNYQKEGIQFNPQHQSVLDMSIKTIEQYIALLQFIKEEWEFVSGVSRQRMGQMGQYEGKATGEQAIIQSSHITEELYRKYAELEQRDLQGLIDCSQIAWLNGKKGNYIMPDGTEKFIDIDPDTFVHEEFGVFVKDANKERYKLEQLKQLGQAAMQNGAPMSIITEIIDSDNFAELKNLVKQAEASMEQMQQQASEMEQQMKQAELEEKQQEREFDAQQNELDRQNKIDIELIKQEFANADVMNMSDEQIQRMKLQLEEKVKMGQLQEEKRSNKAQEKIKAKEIAAKKSTSSSNS